MVKLYTFGVILATYLLNNWNPSIQLYMYKIRQCFYMSYNWENKQGSSFCRNDLLCKLTSTNMIYKVIAKPIVKADNTADSK